MRKKKKKKKNKLSKDDVSPFGPFDSTSPRCLATTSAQGQRSNPTNLLPCRRMAAFGGVIGGWRRQNRRQNRRHRGQAAPSVEK